MYLLDEPANPYTFGLLGRR